MPQYQRGKIYTVVNTINNSVYVGSTTLKLLSTRMTSHRSECKKVERRQSPFYKAMRDLGVENFKIVLHHVFPCNSKDELEAEEMKTLDLIIAAGTPVYNSTIGGKRAKEVIERCAAKMRGALHPNFNSGSLSVRVREGYASWVLQYHQYGLSYSKQFAAKKYGYFTAKKMAQDLRKQVYPEWEPEPEEEFTDELMALELD